MRPIPIDNEYLTDLSNGERQRIEEGRPRTAAFDVQLVYFDRLFVVKALFTFDLQSPHTLTDPVNDVKMTGGPVSCQVTRVVHLFDIRQSSSVDIFKKRLKTFLFDKSYND